MSQIDDEKSIGFSSTTIPLSAKLPSLGEGGAVTTAKVRARFEATAPAPRTQRVASDAAGSGSGSVKGKVSCIIFHSGSKPTFLIYMMDLKFLYRWG